MINFDNNLVGHLRNPLKFFFIAAFKINLREYNKYYRFFKIALVKLHLFEEQQQLINYYLSDGFLL